MTFSNASPPCARTKQQRDSADRRTRSSSSQRNENVEAKAIPRPDDDFLLSTDMVAEMLNIERSTLATWRMTNRVNIPYCRIGKTIKYRRSDVVAFIDSRRVAPQQGDAK